MCQFVPAQAGAEQTLMAMMQAVLRPRRYCRRSTQLDSDRPPLRVIKDPYPTYSAVAMDFKNEEIVLLDENLFQILSYERTAEHSSTGSHDGAQARHRRSSHENRVQLRPLHRPEERRHLRGNNDTLDTLVVFSREAKGDVPPTRELHTPHRTYGIAVDEVRKRCT